MNLDTTDIALQRRASRILKRRKIETWKKHLDEEEDDHDKEEIHLDFWNFPDDSAPD